MVPDKSAGSASRDPDPDLPLPRGRHALPPEVVAGHQRDRIVVAAAGVVAEHGYGGLTVDRIISLARVSRTTFYRNFPDKREALVAAHAKIFARFLAEIEEACRPQTEWAEKVKAGIGAALRFAAAEPAQAQLLASGFVAADLVWARRVRVSHDELAALLRQGRRLHPAAASLPALTEPALVGAIASILARGLVSDDPRLFAALHAQLTQFALIPYLGLAAAAQAVHPA